MKQLLYSHTVTVHGLKWTYRVSHVPVPSDAPACVMVHGLATSNLYMLPTARTLAPSYRVYIPDMPGFGASEKPRNAFSLTQLADLLVEWMHEVGLERVVWLGNSLGCQVIAHIAVRHPECVSHVVFVGPSMDPRALTARQEIVRWLHNLIYEPFQLYGIVLYDFLRAGPRRIIQTLQYALADRIDRHLPQIAAPTLVVRGSRDTVVPQRWAKEATQLLQHGHLCVIEKAAHDTNYNAPVPLAHAIRDFVSRHTT